MKAVKLKREKHLYLHTPTNAFIINMFGTLGYNVHLIFISVMESYPCIHNSE